MALTKVSRGLLSTSIEDNGNATAITIDSSENVGIGTSSPSHKLQVSGSNSAARFSDDGTGYNLDIEHDTSSGITTLQQTNSGGDLRLQGGSSSGLLLFDTGGSERMRIESDGNVRINDSLDNITGTLTLNGRNTGNILFQSGGVEKMRLSGGNLLVGQTALNYNVVGASIDSGGLIRAACTGQVVAFNRKGSNGHISVFYKDGVAVGTISTNANSLPSDRNFKRNIQDLTLGLDFVESLNPVTYNFKIDDEGQAVMTGLIAQEVEEALTAAGVEKNSMTLLQHNPTDDVKESDYQMDYLKFVPILINSIQEQQTLIESLTARIAALEE